MFNKQKTVKLAQDKSVINLLQEEDLISPAFKGFQRIIFSDQVESKRRPQRFNPDFLTKERILQKYTTIESIRESDENIIEYAGVLFMMQITIYWQLILKTK